MEPPSLADQLESLFVLTVKLSHENEDLLDLPTGPPKCENKKGPAKFEIWEKPGTVKLTSIPGNHIMDFSGNDIHNCRECPHCKIHCYSSAAIGQTVGCLNCGGNFQW